MLWLLYPRQAADGAFALEACRFARATSIFDGCHLVERLPICTTLLPCSRLWSISNFGGLACKRRCQVRASIYVWVHLLRVLVGIPLIDTLDSSPRFSTRALALEQTLSRWSSFRGFARATPAGLAAEPLEESLTPLRVTLIFLMELFSISPFSKRRL